MLTEKPRSANQRLYQILQAEREITISVDIEFIEDAEWYELIEEQLKLPGECDESDEYKEFVRTQTRGYEIAGKLFFKKSSREDQDFRTLLLHELGHVVCDLNHTDREGDIMHPDYRKRYGCGSK